MVEDAVDDGQVPVAHVDRAALTVVPALRARSRRRRDGLRRRRFRVDELQVLEGQRVRVGLPAWAIEAEDLDLVAAVERDELAAVDDGAVVVGRSEWR